MPRHIIYYCKLIYCYKVGFLYFQVKILSKLDVFSIIKSKFVSYMIGITFSMSKRIVYYVPRRTMRVIARLRTMLVGDRS